MTPIALMSLLTLGFLAVVFEGSSDDDNTDETPDDSVEFADDEISTGGSDDTADDTDTSDDTDETDTTDDADTETGTDAPARAGIEIGDRENVNLTDADETATILEGSEASSIRASGGDDVLNVFGVSSFVDGEEGNDTITANDARGTTVRGGEGNDSFVIDGEGRTEDGSDYFEAYGELGDDTFTINESSSDIRVHGGDGNDSITGSSDGGIFSGAGGEDVIVTTGEGDLAAGDDGDDVITINDGENGTFDRVDGGRDDDVITLARSEQGFAHEAVYVQGNIGNDTIITQTLLDVEGHADVTDTLDGGGEGIDTFDLSFYLQDGQLPDNDSNADIVIQITDFNPEEDILNIHNEITDPRGEGLGYVLTDDIVIEQLTETRSTDVTLTYVAEDGETQMSMTIRMDDLRDFDFSEENINLV